MFKTKGIMKEDVIFTNPNGKSKTNEGENLEVSETTCVAAETHICMNNLLLRIQEFVHIVILTDGSSESLFNDLSFHFSNKVFDY